MLVSLQCFSPQLTVVCNCGFGTCISSTHCECAPGRVSVNTSSLRCSICAAGFYETRDKLCKGKSRCRSFRSTDISMPSRLHDLRVTTRRRQSDLQVLLSRS